MPFSRSSHRIAQCFDERFGSGVFTSKTVGITRDYSGELTISFECNEAKCVAWVVKDIKMTKAYSDCRGKLKTFHDLAEMISQMGSGDKSSESVVKQAAATLEQKVEEILGIADFQQAITESVKELLPRFFYFADYSSLPYTADITKLLQADEADLDDEELTVLSLLHMAASDDEYLLNPDYELRKRELENVGNALTQDVLEYWSQNPELRVEMDISKEQDVDPEGRPIAVFDELKIRIRDNRHMLSLPFDEHSTGFQWFFSFLAAFSKFEWGNEPLIILLDEPALGLHARAQKDFLRFINERLTDKLQVIYSTHSPFMIESDHLERARVVEDHGRDEGATVSSDVLSTDPDTLFPLQAALGYDIAQHLFIGNNNLVVEGTSDFTYLTVISDFLLEQGRTSLNPGWSVLPVGGIDLIPTFVALLGHHLGVTVVIDGKKGGHQKLSRLADNGYLKHQRIVPIGAVLSRSDADIEDLFTVEDYLKLYNQAYKKSITPPDLQGTGRIVNRIARYEGVDEFNHGRPADVLLRTRDKLLSDFDEETLNHFELLIEKINMTFLTS